MSFLLLLKFELISPILNAAVDPFISFLEHLNENYEDVDTKVEKYHPHDSFPHVILELLAFSRRAIKFHQKHLVTIYNHINRHIVENFHHVAQFIFKDPLSIFEL